MNLRKQGKLHTLENSRLKLIIREDFKCLGSSETQFLINFKRHREAQVYSEFGIRWKMELEELIKMQISVQDYFRKRGSLAPSRNLVSSCDRSRSQIYR